MYLTGEEAADDGIVKLYPHIAWTPFDSPETMSPAILSLSSLPREFPTIMAGRDGAGKWKRFWVRRLTQSPEGSSIHSLTSPRTPEPNNRARMPLFV